MSAALQAAIEFLEQQADTLRRSELNQHENERLKAKVIELENENARLKCEQRPMESNGESITISAEDMRTILDELWDLKRNDIDRMYQNVICEVPTSREYMKKYQPELFALMRRIENNLNN